MLAQRKQLQNNLSVRRLRARLGIVLPLLLAFFFTFTGITTALHQHGNKGYRATAASKAVCPGQASVSAHAVSASNGVRLDTHCPLCDWAHLPRTPAINEAPALTLPTLVAIPSPAPRPVAFFAARFADRSAARAPPAV